MQGRGGILTVPNHKRCGHPCNIRMKNFKREACSVLAALMAFSQVSTIAFAEDVLPQMDNKLPVQSISTPESASESEKENALADEIDGNDAVEVFSHSSDDSENGIPSSLDDTEMVSLDTVADGMYVTLLSGNESVISSTDPSKSVNPVKTVDKDKDSLKVYLDMYSFDESKIVDGTVYYMDLPDELTYVKASGDSATRDEYYELTNIEGDVSAYAGIFKNQSGTGDMFCIKFSDIINQTNVMATYKYYVRVGSSVGYSQDVTANFDANQILFKTLPAPVVPTPTPVAANYSINMSGVWQKSQSRTPSASDNTAMWTNTLTKGGGGATEFNTIGATLTVDLENELPYVFSGSANSSQAVEGVAIYADGTELETDDSGTFIFDGINCVNVDISDYVEGSDNYSVDGHQATTLTFTWNTNDSEIIRNVEEWKIQTRVMQPYIESTLTGNHSAHSSALVGGKTITASANILQTTQTAISKTVAVGTGPNALAQDSAYDAEINTPNVPQYLDYKIDISSSASNCVSVEGDTTVDSSLGIYYFLANEEFYSTTPSSMLGITVGSDLITWENERTMLDVMFIASSYNNQLLCASLNNITASQGSEFRDYTVYESTVYNSDYEPYYLVVEKDTYDLAKANRESSSEIFYAEQAEKMDDHTKFLTPAKWKIYILNAQNEEIGLKYITRRGSASVNADKLSETGNSICNSSMIVQSNKSKEITTKCDIDSIPTVMKAVPEQISGNIAKWLITIDVTDLVNNAALNYAFLKETSEGFGLYGGVDVAMTNCEPYSGDAEGLALDEISNLSNADEIAQSISYLSSNGDESGKWKSLGKFGNQGTNSGLSTLLYDEKQQYQGGGILYGTTYDIARSAVGVPEFVNEVVDEKSGNTRYLITLQYFTAITDSSKGFSCVFEFESCMRQSVVTGTVPETFSDTAHEFTHLLSTMTAATGNATEAGQGIKLSKTATDAGYHAEANDGVHYIDYQVKADLKQSDGSLYSGNIKFHDEINKIVLNNGEKNIDLDCNDGGIRYSLIHLNVNTGTLYNASESNRINTKNQNMDIQVTTSAGTFNDCYFVSYEEWSTDTGWFFEVGLEFDDNPDITGIMKFDFSASAMFGFDLELFGLDDASEMLLTYEAFTPDGYIQELAYAPDYVYDTYNSYATATITNFISVNDSESVASCELTILASKTLSIRQDASDVLDDGKSAEFVTSIQVGNDKSPPCTDFNCVESIQDIANFENGFMNPLDADANTVSAIASSFDVSNLKISVQECGSVQPSVIYEDGSFADGDYSGSKVEFSEDNAGGTLFIIYLNKSESWIAFSKVIVSYTGTINMDNLVTEPDGSKTTLAESSYYTGENLWIDTKGEASVDVELDAGGVIGRGDYVDGRLMVNASAGCKFLNVDPITESRAKKECLGTALSDDKSVITTQWMVSIQAGKLGENETSVNLNAEDRLSYSISKGPYTGILEGKNAPETFYLTDDRCAAINSLMTESTTYSNIVLTLKDMNQKIQPLIDSVIDGNERRFDFGDGKIVTLLYDTSELGGFTLNAEGLCPYDFIELSYETELNWDSVTWRNNWELDNGNLIASNGSHTNLSIMDSSVNNAATNTLLMNGSSNSAVNTNIDMNVSIEPSVSKESLPGSDSGNLKWKISMTSGNMNTDQFIVRDEPEIISSNKALEDYIKDKSKLDTITIDVNNGAACIYNAQMQESPEEDRYQWLNGWDKTMLSVTVNGLDFEVKFADTGYGSNVIHNNSTVVIDYGYSVDINDLYQIYPDMPDSEKYTIENIATLGDGKSDTCTLTFEIPSKEMSIRKDGFVNGTGENYAYWYMYAESKEFDRSNVVLTDTLSSSTAQVVESTSLKSMSINYIKRGSSSATDETIIVYDTERNVNRLSEFGISLTDKEGEPIKLGANGKCDFVVKKDFLEKNTCINVCYYTKFDSAHFRNQTEGNDDVDSVRCRNDVLMEADSATSCTDYETMNIPIVVNSTKSGIVSGKTTSGNDIITWTIQGKLNGKFTNQEIVDADSYTITDVLAPGLKYVDGSAKVNISTSLYTVDVKGQVLKVTIRPPSGNENTYITFKTESTASMSNIVNYADIEMYGKHESIESPPIDNTFSSGQSGTISSDLKRYDFSFTKTDSSTWYPLADAAFSLTSDSVVEPNTSQFINRVAVSNSMGIVRFPDLPNGMYILTETSAPQGYKLPGGTWTILLKAGICVAATPNGTTTEFIISSPGNLKLPNTESLDHRPLFVLPKSGGNGTIPYAMAGILFGATAFMLFTIFFISKRKNRGKSND